MDLILTTASMSYTRVKTTQNTSPTKLLPIKCLYVLFHRGDAEVPSESDFTKK